MDDDFKHADKFEDEIRALIDAVVGEAVAARAHRGVARCAAQRDRARLARRRRGRRRRAAAHGLGGRTAAGRLVEPQAGVQLQPPLNEIREQVPSLSAGAACLGRRKGCLGGWMRPRAEQPQQP